MNIQAQLPQLIVHVRDGLFERFQDIRPENGFRSFREVDFIIAFSFIGSPNAGRHLDLKELRQAAHDLCQRSDQRRP